jgi:phage baseplate assembly protein W
MTVAFDEPFLGDGWSFPPAFDRNLAEVEMTSGLDDIKASLEIIFSTALGERIMSPTFGCNLDDKAFDPMNSSTLAYIENLLKTAILYHEPRIDADKIEVVPDAMEGILMIQIEFIVRTSNSRFNFVYPYYISSDGV